MAQATLLEMAREIVLYSDDVCPILLAKRWVRDRYRKICEKNLWSFKLGRSAFGTTDAYTTGTLTLTNNSATVTGSSTVWVAAHVGQQLKVDGYVFTISAVAGNTSLTIDQTWLGDTTADLTYRIVQAYITPSPSDFFAFYSVIDPVSRWKLRLGINSKELDRIDAARTSNGTPYLLANGVYNSSQVAMYELWPSPNTRQHYMYMYEKRIADLADWDTPPPIIRSDILIKGALADLARWPGTPERRNVIYDPYFNQWKTREAEFLEELNKAMVEDNSIMLNDLAYGTDYGYSPIDTNFMQSHAFPAY